MRALERPGVLRDRLAYVLALATVACIGLAITLEGNRFLTPGPLSSAHSSIEACSSCHSASGSGPLSWLKGLVPRERLADSKACITCHKVPEPGFNAHGAKAEVLQQSTRRLTEVAEKTPMPTDARLQNLLFPTNSALGDEIACGTCHQEHKGANVTLNRITDEQCRSCHTVKFDSFDGYHPKFENYPHERRTRIIYDHASHFGKHYPELAKKEPSAPIPQTCTSCHDSKSDKQVMGLAPFEKTCAGCHLDQITGKQRASGPKGVAFLSLPGLDMQTLKKKKAVIGEWPSASEAGLTPFMKVMISRSEKGRAIVEAVDKLDLKDLSGARDDQIKAVTELVWETKGLFYSLVKGKASDVLGGLEAGVPAVPGAARMADLTASLPQDVVIGAQQQWLPNLGVEMAERMGLPVPRPAAIPSADTARADPPTRDANTKVAAPTEVKAATNTGKSEEKPSTEKSEQPSAEAESASSTPQPATPAGQPVASATARNPQDCLVRVFGECLAFKSSADTGGPRPDGASRLTPPMRLGAEPSGTASVASTEKSIDNQAAGHSPSPQTKLAQARQPDPKDDLLFPTEEELRAIKPGKNADRLSKPVKGAVKPETSGSAPPEAAPSEPSPVADRTSKTAQRIEIESSLEPENWAEHGGWYRQDYAISYRPAGHKDRFLYSWLTLTGPQAPKGGTRPGARVFATLARSDAPGSCVKCHSVDETAAKGQAVNFSPLKAAHKNGRFTRFAHEPHLGTMDAKGCLSCHEMQKGQPYLKSYEQGNPLQASSNFRQIEKSLCQSCHATNQARQDCLLCHKYHVNGVAATSLDTKLPSE